MLALRPYQAEALAALADGWKSGLQRIAVVQPTGTGKTVVFAHLIARALAEGRRPIVLVHREELAQQAADKIRSVSPGITVGIVKAERDEVNADVVVASVPTLARAKRMAGYLAATGGRGEYQRRLVVVDEAHHVMARTWVEVLTALGAFVDPNKDNWGIDDNDTRVAGFTATMAREDGRGLGDVWQSIVYRMDILEGIAGGFLCDVRGLAVTVDGFDLATIAKSRGDYQEGQLGAALEESGAGAVIAERYKEHAADRPGVIFAPTVDTAHSFADVMNDAGIRTEVIVGTTGTDERNAIYRRYREGATQVLSNCMVLTEGWDAPHASCAVIARPTQSAALYTQMVGRVLRPFPGKLDALVLDVVGISAVHALRTIADLTATHVKPEPGESLASAIEREAAERESRPVRPGQVGGLIAAQDVDLFHRSTSVWLRTYKGIMFVPTKDWTYFLWPQEDGAWKVGRKPTWRNRGVKGGWLQEGLTLGYAMAWGEADAAEVDASVSQKSASWRRKSNPPSEAQLGQVAKFKLIVPDGANRSEVSDIISVHFASRDLDPEEARNA